MNLYTESQIHAIAHLRKLAHLHFNVYADQRPLKSSLNPLFAAPTGAGKSFLLRAVAKEFSAHYLPIPYGDWMGQGDQRETGMPSVIKIIEALKEHPRVLLHIGGLEKFGNQANGATSSWDPSIRTDLWNVLDYSFPGINPSDENGHTASVRARLWIVGTGTWQGLCDESSIRPLNSNSEPRAETINRASDIAHSKVIPLELMARFHGDILLMHYPSREAEIQKLLDQFGLTELSEKLGVSIDIPSLKTSITAQGMRAFGILKSRLKMEEMQQHTNLTAGLPAVSLELDRENDLDSRFKLLMDRIDRLAAQCNGSE